MGALSYLDRLAITVVADRNTIRDLGVFTAAARRDLDRLCPAGIAEGAGNSSGQPDEL